MGAFGPDESAKRKSVASHDLGLLILGFRLTLVGKIHVKAPLVKESAFSMECEVLVPTSYILTSDTHRCVHRQLFQATDIKIPDTQEHTCTLILGLVKYIHVRNDVLTVSGESKFDVDCSESERSIAAASASMNESGEWGSPLGR